MTSTNKKITKNKSKYRSSPIRPFRLWQDDSRESETRIEILPLIDVIFCILTFLSWRRLIFLDNRQLV